MEHVKDIIIFIYLNTNEHNIFTIQYKILERSIKVWYYKYIYILVIFSFTFTSLVYNIPTHLFLPKGLYNNVAYRTLKGRHFMPISHARNTH